ncbi:hypothetical protein KHA80_10950 [Anaerobacillus sp. HL2]|nr:hypothetical protein KHA80_10950 [Anaerobacillus sp. HL2]
MGMLFSKQTRGYNRSFGSWKNLTENYFEINDIAAADIFKLSNEREITYSSKKMRLLHTSN